MDAMTLLCNLHADGPTTRDRLRQAGCDSLADLLTLPAGELSRVLDSTPAFARRFLREASILIERCATSPLEAEDEGPIGWHAGTPLSPGAVAGLDAEWCRRLVDAGIDTLEALVEVSALDLSRRRGLPCAPLMEIQCLAARALRTEARPATGGGNAAVEPTRALVAPGAQGGHAPGPAGQPLRPDLLEGLDEPCCLRLASGGVGTVEALADAPAFELSRELGLPFPRVLDLQHLARRHLGTVLIPAPRPRSALRGQPATLEGSVPSAQIGPAVRIGSRELDPSPGGPFA